MSSCRDANGDVVAVKAEELLQPMAPAALEATLTGTSLENMQLVENVDSDRALGRMRILAMTWAARSGCSCRTRRPRIGEINFTFPLFFQDDRRTYLVTRLLAA